MEDMILWYLFLKMGPMSGVWDGSPWARVVGLQIPLLNTVLLVVFASPKPLPVTAHGTGRVQALAHALCSALLLAQMEKHAW